MFPWLSPWLWCPAKLRVCSLLVWVCNLSQRLIRWISACCWGWALSCQVCASYSIVSRSHVYQQIQSVHRCCALRLHVYESQSRAHVGWLQSTISKDRCACVTTPMGDLTLLRYELGSLCWVGHRLAIGLQSGRDWLRTSTKPLVRFTRWGNIGLSQCALLEVSEVDVPILRPVAYRTPRVLGSGFWYGMSSPRRSQYACFCTMA